MSSVPVRRHDLNAEAAEAAKDDLADHEVPSETVGPLDEHEPDAVTLQEVQEGRQADAAVELLRPRDALVRELLDELKALGAREPLDRVTLAGKAVATHLLLPLTLR